MSYGRQVHSIPDPVRTVPTTAGDRPGHYFVVDDYVNDLGCEAFEVFCGDPMEARGFRQASFKTIAECEHYLKQHLVAGEPYYRVQLKRRHGEHRVIERFLTPQDKLIHLSQAAASNALPEQPADAEPAPQRPRG